MRAELEFASHEALLRYLDEINAGAPLPGWVLRQAQVASGVEGNTPTIGSCGGGSGDR